MILRCKSHKKEFAVWTPFDEEIKYFEPSAKDFMINYRVKNLKALVKKLRKNGVTIMDANRKYCIWKICSHIRH
jgi:hypothetical protein